MWFFKGLFGFIGDFSKNALDSEIMIIFTNLGKS